MSFSDVISACSDEEKLKMDELKRRIYPELPPLIRQDETLYFRFLKARDFNFKNAEILLRKHLCDRKIFDWDNLYESYDCPKSIGAYIPFSFIGYDKEGCGVTYADGACDLKGLLQVYTVKDMAQFACFTKQKFLDQMTERSRKNGKLQFVHTMIVNMENSNALQLMNKSVLELLIEGFRIYQNNFPERLKVMRIINVTRHLHLFLSIIKATLSDYLIQKIQVHGYTGWQEILLDTIDAEVLPAFLGGKRTDPDGNPLCRSVITHAAKVPVELYRKRQSISHDEGIKRLTISRGSKCEVDVYNDVPGAIVECEFEVTSNDIDFAIHYTGSIRNSEIKEILPKHRVDTTLGSNIGTCKCEKAGTYKLLFDNTFSWLHSKEIFYRIRLVEPDGKIITNY